MEEYQKRVIEEKEELDKKIKKLASFLDTGMFVKLTKDDVGLLRTQHSIMLAYRTILKMRINVFYKN